MGKKNHHIVPVTPSASGIGNDARKYIMLIGKSINQKGK